jgi:hypothetical protein
MAVYQPVFSAVRHDIIDRQCADAGHAVISHSIL